MPDLCIEKAPRMVALSTAEAFSEPHVGHPNTQLFLVPQHAFPQGTEESLGLEREKTFNVTNGLYTHRTTQANGIKSCFFGSLSPFDKVWNISKSLVL